MSAPTIHQRIHAVMLGLRGVEKSGRHQQGGYAYAGHEAIASAIRPLFVEHGIVQTIDCGEAVLLDGGHVRLNVNVTWTSVDNPESFITGSVPAVQQCQTKAGNPTAQQVGQAISYAVKNFQLKTLMLLDSNEVEGESLPHESPHVVDREAEAAAESMLKQYSGMHSEAEVKLHDKACRERWPEVRGLQNISDRYRKARQEALDRIKGAAQ